MTAENLKPRNAKPPLHLLPWRTLLALCPEHVPPDVAAAIRATGTEHGRAFMEHVGRALLRRAGPEAIAAAFASGLKPRRPNGYLPFNWQEDPSRQSDYEGALFRHLCAEHGSFGETPHERDYDSGELHSGHAAASVWIWLHHDGATATASEADEEWSYFRSAADAEACAAEARSHGDVVRIVEPPLCGLQRWSVRVVRFGAKEG